MKLELTTTEAETLMQLLDLATKAGGLNVAAQALPLAQKLDAAIRSEIPTTTPE